MEKELIDYAGADAYQLEKQDEQKIIKVKPKFTIGDHIIHRGIKNVCEVIAVLGDEYRLKHGDSYTVRKCTDVDKYAKLLNQRHRLIATKPKRLLVKRTQVYNDQNI